MNKPDSHRGIDAFKSILALILLVVFIWLLLASRQAAASSPAAQLSPSAAALISPSAGPAEPSSTATLPPPSATPLPSIAPTRTPAVEAAPSLTPAVSASPTSTTAAVQASTPVAGPVDCPLALPTRLKLGERVRVTDNLNLRAAPQVSGSLLLTHPLGTELDVVGGPVCTPYQEGAYLWWELRGPGGDSGWSAEGSLTGRFYFLEPLP